MGRGALALVRMSGPRVRDVLAKGVPLDLHPKVFKLGDVANTLVAYVGVQIDMLDDAPIYQLTAPRSTAGRIACQMCGAMLLALELAVVPAAAQLTTATIAGSIHDETGAALPGATVTVTNVNTGLSRSSPSTYSRSSGFSLARSASAILVSSTS